jgi:nitroreductase
MDVIEAIKSRKSVRAFKTDPVPREVLQAIMEAALRAPSWANTQPWEFAIVGGEVMRKLSAALVDKASSGEMPNPDLPLPSFEGPYRERMQSTGMHLFQELSIARDDKETRLNWMLAMSRFFDAPNAIIVYMDASLGEWSLVDIGLTLENLMLAAWHYGVGTCPEAAVVLYPEALRSLLKIPESKRIILGLAVGYPDFSSPVMKFRSERESLEALVGWHGFD